MNFILPAWSAAANAFVWPATVQLCVVDASGTRPAGTRTLHCSSEGCEDGVCLRANTIIPCLGVARAFDPANAATFAGMFPACVSPRSGVAIDGGIMHRPYALNTTTAVHSEPVPFASSSAGGCATVPIACDGLSLFPYVREPPQTGSMRMNAVLRPAPRDWLKGCNADYEPLRAWLTENWALVRPAVGLDATVAISYDVFPLSVIHIIDDVPQLREILALVNHFDFLGRRSEYHPPAPLLLLPHDVLVKFVDAVPGFTMKAMKRLFECNRDQARLYSEAFSRVIQKDQAYLIEAYAAFVSDLTATLKAWGRDMEMEPPALPPLPHSIVVTKTNAGVSNAMRSTPPPTPFVHFPQLSMSVFDLAPIGSSSPLPSYPASASPLPLSSSLSLPLPLQPVSLAPTHSCPSPSPSPPVMFASAQQNQHQHQHNKRSRDTAEAGSVSYPFSMSVFETFGSDTSGSGFVAATPQFALTPGTSSGGGGSGSGAFTWSSRPFTTASKILKQ